TTRPPEGRRRNSRSDLSSGVEIFRFERVVPADTPSHVNEGTVRCKRLPILHSHGRGVFRKPERGAWRNTGRVVDLVVLEVDPLLLLVRVRGPGLSRWCRRCALVNQENELHRWPLLPIACAAVLHA